MTISRSSIRQESYRTVEYPAVPTPELMSMLPHFSGTPLILPSTLTSSLRTFAELDFTPTMTPTSTLSSMVAPTTLETDHQVFEVSFADYPSCWRDVQDALAAGIDRLILYGPPGTGKTYSGLTTGDVSAGSFRLICTEEMTSADVIGHFMPSSNGMWTWVEGSVVRAWNGDGQRGGRVVADEIDRASGDVLALLLNMFDTHDSASWQHPETGVVHRPRPGFSVVMTSNIEELGLIPAALRDRFPVSIRIDQPHPLALARLSPYLRVPATASADADDLRRFSLRAFYAFDHLCNSGMAFDRAAHLVFGEHSADVLDALLVNHVDQPVSAARIDRS